MANFTATLRMDYRDVSGLLLSCTRADIEEDLLNPGFVRRWRNRAPGMSSYAGGRYGDLLQPVQARQPELATVLSQRKVKFNRASTQFLESVIPASTPSVRAAIAFQFTQGVSVADTQVIYDDQVSAKVTRRQAGVGRFQVGSRVGVLGADMPSGRWLLTSNTTGIAWSRDRTLNTGTTAGVQAAGTISGTAYVGRSAAGDYLDGYLDGIHIWGRELSPLEQDFIWFTLDADGAEFALEDRVSPLAKLWTDFTGTPGTSQIDRVRNEVATYQYFKLATLPSSAPKRIQIAASEDGIVKPDSLLTDGVFSPILWLELPGAVPVVTRSAGWSSVYDCHVQTEGHYVAKVTRPDGGAVLIHFDVEVTA